MQEDIGNVKESKIHHSTLDEIPESPHAYAEESSPKYTKNNRIILVLTIDIGSGKTGSIRVKEKDDPLMLAKEFCKEHNLANEIIPILTNYIRKNISDKIILDNTSQSSNNSNPKSGNLDSTKPSFFDRHSINIPNHQTWLKSKSVNSTPVKRMNSVRNTIANIYEDLAQKEQFSHVPAISKKSVDLVRSKSLTARSVSVHDRLFKDYGTRKESKMNNTYRKEGKSMLEMNNNTILNNSLYTTFNKYWTNCHVRYPTRSKLLSQTFQQSNSTPRQIPKNEYPHTGGSFSSRIGIKDHYFIKMYRNQKETRKIRKELVSLNRDEKVRSEDRHLTFTPRLTDTTRTLTLRPFIEPEIRCLELGKVVEAKKERARTDRLRELDEECKFKPEINEISMILGERKRSKSTKGIKNNTSGFLSKSMEVTTLFKTLHEEAIFLTQNRIKKQKADQQIKCPFKPTISKCKSATKAKYLKKPVVERMHKHETEKQKLNRELRRDKHFREENFDLESGKKLYAPTISRGPKVARRPANENICLFLNKNEELNTKKIKTREKLEKERSENIFKDYSMDKSDTIVEKTKKARYKEIFEMLDSDNDGKISAAKIDIKFLNSELLEVLTPILLKLEQDRIKLNMGQFSSYCEKYAKNLTVTQKNIITGPHKREPSPEKLNYLSLLSFCPKLTSKSELLAKNKRDKIGTLSEFLYKDSKNKQKKNEEYNNIKQCNEMKPCTFHPIIHEFNKRIFKAAPRQNSREFEIYKKQLLKYIYIYILDFCLLQRELQIIIISRYKYLREHIKLDSIYLNTIY